MRLDNINRDIIIIRGVSLPAGKLAFKAGDRAPWINNVPPFKIFFFLLQFFLILIIFLNLNNV
jgi:hypothetical protein